MNVLLIRNSELVSPNRAAIALDRLLSEFGEREFTLGREFRAGVEGGALGRARVVVRSATSVEFDLELQEMPPPLFPIDLLVAVPRPQMIRRIVEQVAAIGVQSLTFVGAENTEKSYLSSHILRPDELQKTLERGLMQGGATLPPTVQVAASLRKLLRHDWRSNALQVLATPIAERTLEGVLSSQPIESGSVALAIGPEKGWSEEEVSLFRDAGFQPVSLGARILRVETAVVWCAAQAIGALRQKRESLGK